MAESPLPCFLRVMIARIFGCRVNISTRQLQVIKETLLRIQRCPTNSGGGVVRC